MADTTRAKIKITAPETAFQQMCNFAAIAETKNPDESLRELILHAFVTFDNENATSAQDVADILRTIFGVDVPSYQVQEALDQLTADGQVHKPLGTNYVLSPDARTKIKARIKQATQLQERVRFQWYAEMIGRFPGLNAEQAWEALENYLAKAFLRHGIQVVAFLDPTIELPPDYAASLSSLLAEAVNSKFDPAQQAAARHAISEFLTTAGNFPERSQFIAECADGAANFFSLAVSPEVAVRFREKLSPLRIFCDTNFLFGILDLHVHSQVEVSNQLLHVIIANKLPFKLRYHEATLRETEATIAYYASQLRRSRWSPSLSRAATTSPYVSGIELKYHKKNAETGIDVDSFLRPYNHVDILLKEKGIDVYKPSSERLAERATLQAEYNEFLKGIRKEKPYEAVNHDVTVLDCVQSLRNNAGSTLEAGALLLTCDYTLYRFDCDASRKSKAYASVVLPNILWQILRPFLPASQDFDKSFAETFAIPEFRTIGSGAAKACSKMLNLLAAYKDIPEETAARLLSNDVLIDRLRAVESEEQFQEQVESAIAMENQALLEERAALAIQVEALRTDKEQAEKELERQKQESANMQEMILAKEKETEALTASKKDAEAKIQDVSAKLAKIEKTMASAERSAEDESEARRKAEHTVQKYRIFAAIIVSVLLVVVFETFVYATPWTWLRNHTNSFGLQGCIDFMLIAGNLGFWIKRWRKEFWIAGFIGAFLVMLQLLGGPKPGPN